MFVPFAEGDTPREPWYVDFLVHLSANGGRSLAASHVGISRKKLRAALATDPVFAEEVEAAESFYRELLEWESVNLARTKNNPLPFFARLKAELPARYVEKSIVHVDQHHHTLDFDPTALLKAMLADITNTTRRRLTGADRIIDVSPAAEPGAAEAE